MDMFSDRRIWTVLNFWGFLRTERHRIDDPQLVKDFMDYFRMKDEEYAKDIIKRFKNYELISLAGI